MPVMIWGQTSYNDFEPNTQHPFGKPNPKAPTQITDWAELIGESECKSISRNPDGTWADTLDMIWRFKYIMNGWAVQDETLKADGKNAGSIRQYNADSAAWYVHYYSSGYAAPVLPAWKGNINEEGEINLYKEQQAPNGMEGFYKISFTEISEKGFNWLGQWVNPDESIIYPTWKIYCRKRKD